MKNILVALPLLFLIGCAEAPIPVEKPSPKSTYLDYSNRDDKLSGGVK